MAHISDPPTNFGVVLFPGFQLLDAAGPLDILNILSMQRKLNLSILASTLEPVSTRVTGMNTTGSNFGESIMPTHTYSAPPPGLEVLLVPGGLGTRSEENIAPVTAFIKSIYPSLKYLITVCTGAAIVAKTGILDGRRATTNKKAWAWATAQGPNVQWVQKARWVVDGNVWTSSGISAGIDTMYAFVGEMFGEDVADEIANSSEYERCKDSERDPWASFWQSDGGEPARE